MNNFRRTADTVIALTALIALLAISLTQQSRAAEAFQPDTVRMTIPSDPGGGTDSMARVTGRFLGKYLPGTPTFIYLNDPSAAGVKALNNFTKRVKPDGLTIYAGSSSNIDPTTLRNPAVLYTAKELRMFGGFPAPSGVLLLRKDALGRFHDKALPPATMGDVNAVRTSGQMGAWGPAYLGWNVRWVIGYKGSREVMLALQRGEVDMHATFEREIITRLMDSGDFVTPVQTGVISGERLVRGKHYPEIPVFSDLVRPLLKSPREISAFQAWEIIVQGGKWFALPPGTPDEIVAIYRNAFDRAVRDPDFAPMATKFLGEDFTTATGAEMDLMADKTDLISDSDVAYFEELREKVGLRAQAKP